MRAVCVFKAFNNYMKWTQDWVWGWPSGWLTVPPRFLFFLLLSPPHPKSRRNRGKESSKKLWEEKGTDGRGQPESRLSELVLQVVRSISLCTVSLTFVCVGSLVGGSTEINLLSPCSLVSSSKGRPIRRRQSQSSAELYLQHKGVMSRTLAIALLPAIMCTRRMRSCGPKREGRGPWKSHTVSLGLPSCVRTEIWMSCRLVTSLWHVHIIPPVPQLSHIQ